MEFVGWLGSKEEDLRIPTCIGKLLRGGEFGLVGDGGIEKICYHKFMEVMKWEEFYIHRFSERCSLLRTLID